MGCLRGGPRDVLNRLTAELEGFSSMEVPLTVRRGKLAAPVVRLSTAMDETITVTSETPLLDARTYNQQQAQSREGRLAPVWVGTSTDVLGDFQGAVTQGVKPLPVVIPESGKVIELSGALPPTDVWVTVDVRKR